MDGTGPDLCLGHNLLPGCGILFSPTQIRILRAVSRDRLNAFRGPVLEYAAKAPCRALQLNLIPIPVYDWPCRC